MSKKPKQEMATLTVSIPDWLKKELDEMPEVDWSAYLKERIIERVRQLIKFEHLVHGGKI